MLVYFIFSVDYIDFIINSISIPDRSKMTSEALLCKCAIQKSVKENNDPTVFTLTQSLARSVDHLAGDFSVLWFRWCQQCHRIMRQHQVRAIDKSCTKNEAY